MIYKNMRLNLKTFSAGTCLAALLLASPLTNTAMAQYPTDEDVVLLKGANATIEAPPTIGYLNNLEVDDTDETLEEFEKVEFDIRKEAIREAALSYGARGGLAFRTYEIRQELDNKARYLDKVFNFRQLLIKAPSGFLIEPPVITEAENNMLVDNGGMEAAVTDRMYNINTNVKIVTAPKNWRQYLEREWGKVDPPPNILRPVNRVEREIWKEKVAEGWKEGYQQADEVFESDLSLLVAHFRGMVRYRTLLAQGMVSPTMAVQTDRGITGGGNEMRIGDRAVQIVDVPQLIPETTEWSPENR